MAKNNVMYRITFKRRVQDDTVSFVVDRIIVSDVDLFKMCERIMKYYPESVAEGNFIKFEEVDF